MGTIEKIIIMRDVIRNIIHSQMSDFQCFQINHRILRAHNFTAREKKNASELKTIMIQEIMFIFFLVNSIPEFQ